MKNNLVRLSLLIIVLVQFGYIAYLHTFEFPFLANTITELNRGSEIDYQYVNKANEYNVAIYDMWSMCNTTLSADLKGELSVNDLDNFMTKYQEKSVQMEKIGEEVVKLKEDRTKILSDFRFATVYRPE